MWNNIQIDQPEIHPENNGASLVADNVAIFIQIQLLSLKQLSFA